MRQKHFLELSPAQLWNPLWRATTPNPLTYLGGPAGGLCRAAKFPFYQTFNYSPYECLLV